jgi:hypothetical protein
MVHVLSSILLCQRDYLSCCAWLFINQVMATFLNYVLLNGNLKMLGVGRAYRYQV